MNDATAIIENLSERALRKRLTSVERERFALIALLRAKRAAAKTERGQGRFQRRSTKLERQR